MRFFWTKGYRIQYIIFHQQQQQLFSMMWLLLEKYLATNSLGFCSHSTKRRIKEMESDIKWTVQLKRHFPIFFWSTLAVVELQCTLTPFFPWTSRQDRKCKTIDRWHFLKGDIFLNGCLLQAVKMLLFYAEFLFFSGGATTSLFQLSSETLLYEKEPIYIAVTTWKGPY